MDHDIDAVIASRGEFQAALRDAFARAATGNARELWLADPDFADWPLSEPGVVESLQRWARPYRRLTVIAHTFDEVVRRHARWAEWRRTWAHVVECRSNAELEAVEVPTILLAPGVVSVRLLDTVHHRGTVSGQTGDHLRCKEAIDAVLQRSAESFPATTLGL